MPIPRLFTVAEAERALPLVRRIVQDIMVEYPAWREAVARYEALTVPARDEPNDSGALREVRDEVSRRAERINGFLGELESIGCVFKGFDAGLVDFYALRDDQLVFICWKLGEEGITHWHEIDSGFEGRQPIDAPMLTGTVP